MWRGRLAIKSGADPAQSFSAGFELRGTAERGALALYSPLGTTLADLHWTPGSAWLVAQGQRHAFESLDALVRHALGTSVPVAALFEWLQGRAAGADGWEVDLTQQPRGRLAARRSWPEPVTELRLVLEQ